MIKIARRVHQLQPAWATECTRGPALRRIPEHSPGSVRAEAPCSNTTSSTSKSSVELGLRVRDIAGIGQQTLNLFVLIHHLFPYLPLFATSPQKSYRSGLSDVNPTRFPVLGFFKIPALLSSSTATLMTASPLLLGSDSFKLFRSIVDVFVAGVVLLSPTPPSKSRCRVSNSILLRIHLNARLFSPPPADADDATPRNVENLSLGAKIVWGAGKACTRTNPWWDGNMAIKLGFAIEMLISFQTVPKFSPVKASKVMHASTAQPNFFVQPRPPQLSVARCGHRHIVAHTFGC